MKDIKSPVTLLLLCIIFVSLSGLTRDDKVDAQASVCEDIGFSGHFAAFSPTTSPNFLLFKTDHSINLTNSKGEWVYSYLHEGPSWETWHPTGSVFATVSYDRILVRSAFFNRESAMFEVTDQLNWEKYVEELTDEFSNAIPTELTFLVWNPNGNKLGFVHGGFFSIWDLEGGTVELAYVPPYQFNSDAVRAQWSTSGEFIALVLQFEILILDSSNFAVLAQIDISDVKEPLPTSDIFWSLDDTQLVVALADPLPSGPEERNAQVAFIDVSTGVATKLYNIGSPMIPNIAWSPDRHWLAVATDDEYFGRDTSGENSVQIWDTVNDELVDTIRFDDEVRSVSWSPDNTQLAIAGWPQNICVYSR